MRSVGTRGRALLFVAAAVPALHGCAEIAGLEDRKVGEGARAQLVALVSDQSFPYGVALDADAVYWTNGGGRDAGGVVRAGEVRKRLKRDATIIDLASSFEDAPHAIALDEKNVYWSSAPVGEDGCNAALDRVQQIPKDAATPNAGKIELWASCGLAESIALDTSRVYSARPTANRVTTYKKGGGGFSDLRPIGMDGEPFGVAADAEFVYFTDRVYWGIYVYDKIGSVTIFLGDLAEAPGHLVLDDTHFYWLAPHSVVRYPRQPAEGEAPMVLFDGVQAPGGLAAHGGYLYVTDSEAGLVYRIQADGAGEPVPIAADQGYPTGIAADETGVYWANTRAGQIMRWGSD